MKRALTAIAAAFLGWRIYCAVRGRHNPQRAHPLGAFRCPDCGRTTKSLEDFDGVGAGYVSPTRRVFSRDSAGGHSETSRVQGYES